MNNKEMVLKNFHTKAPHCPQKHEFSSDRFFTQFLPNKIFYSLAVTKMNIHYYHGVTQFD